MAVDRNLFLYDLAVVAIMKNEAPYAKEWLDYHLLAGVDHFYIYDHESTDNFKEVLQPYIKAGIVDYIFFTGEMAQNAAYDDAVNKYKFFCRYMAFIDCDEFIFPQNDKSIAEVVDEILAGKNNAGGLGINWRMYGSNNLETADYSKGVLERFTSCQKGYNQHVKTIANPRTIKFISIPHFAFYFENYFSVNESGGIFQGAFNNPPTGNKICINHYRTKSKEEFLRKAQRGRVDTLQNTYKVENFKHANNEVFDDGILKYRENRVRTLIPDGGGAENVLESLAAIKQIDYQKLCVALVKNLAPVFSEKSTPQNFTGQMETFLTCRALASYLRKEVLGDTAGKIFEETALNAILKSFAGNFSIADFRLLISELPEILRLNYPVVEQIRKVCINFVPQLMNIFRMNGFWREFKEMYYFGEMLKTFDKYNHK